MVWPPLAARCNVRVKPRFQESGGVGRISEVKTIQNDTKLAFDGRRRIFSPNFLRLTWQR